MIELGGKPGELAITLEIKRAATGETETVQLIGTMTGAEAWEILPPIMANNLDDQGE